MSERGETQWVWRSDRASSAAGTLSVLAVLETLVCVILFWLPVYFGVTFQLWIVLLATPLILFRSEASTTKGAQWFNYYLSNPPTMTIWSLKWFACFCLPTSLILIITRMLVEFLRDNYQGYDLLWAGSLFGISVICLVVATSKAIRFSAPVLGAAFFFGAVLAITYHLAAYFDGITSYENIVSMIGGAITHLIVALFLIVSSAFLGVWLRAAIVRLIATLFHPIAGLRSLPENWRRVVLSEDVFSYLELVPGHPNSAAMMLEGFLKEQRTMTLSFRREMFFGLTWITHLSVFLWRVSIKSTAWFFFPWIVLGRGWVLEEGPELLVWGKSYTQKLWNRISLISAVVLMVLAFAQIVAWNELVGMSQRVKESGAPWSPFLFLFVVDWSALETQPWHWFYLPSWVLTIYLFFSIDAIRKELAEGGTEERRLSKLESYRWWSNLRTVLTNIGLTLALLYVLDSVGAWEQIKDFATELYTKLHVCMISF